jgi:hypothetical protein
MCSALWVIEHAGCVSYSSNCCGRGLTERNNLKQEGLTLPMVSDLSTRLPGPVFLGPK